MNKHQYFRYSFFFLLSLLFCPNILFSQDLTVAPSQTYTVAGEETFDNVTVDSGGVLVVDSILNVNNNMTVLKGGVVTHTVRLLAGLTLNVMGTLEVQSGGKIDVNEKGLLAGGGGQPGEAYNEAGEIIPGASYGNKGAGASYGGYGSKANGSGSIGTPNEPYGLLEDPIYLGAGGSGGQENSGGNGGGLLNIQATTLVLDGEIVANGGDGAYNQGGGSGGGSGGGIRLDIGILAGAGFIRANGGQGVANSNSSNSSGSGGGGRIAVYYDSLTITEENIQAFGGDIGNVGAPGTIYLKDNSHPLGRLINRNNNFSSVAVTPLKTDIMTFEEWLIDQGGRLDLKSTDIGQVTVENPVIVSNNSTLTVNKNVTLQITNTTGFDINVLSGSTFTLDSLSVFDANSILISGNSTFNTLIDFSFPNGDDLELSDGTINILNGTTFQLSYFDTSNIKSGTVNLTAGATLEVSSNAIDVATGLELVKDGFFGASDEIGSLTIHSGGTITHSGRFLPGLTLNVTGTMEVQAGGAIDVTGKGLLGGTCCPKTKGETFDENGQVVPGAEYTDGGAGGSYGGYGGQYIGYDVAYPFSPYGLIENPALLGSGGGSGGGYSPTPGIKTGGDGGGLVIVNTAKLLLNGDITANGAEGAYLGGSGSGGGIKITVDSLLGSGKISANGGDGTDLSGSGGGGRIALFFKYIDTPGPNSSAYGGKCIFTGNGCGNLTTGAAGTIYLKNVNQPNGKLIVNNNNVSAASKTPLISNLNTFEEWVIAMGGRLNLDSSDVEQVTVQKPVMVSDNATFTLHKGVTVHITNPNSFDINVLGGSTFTLDSLSVFDANSILVSGHSIFNTLTDFSFPNGGDLELLDGTINILNGTTFQLSYFDTTNIKSGTVNLTEGATLEVSTNAIDVATGLEIVKDGFFGASDEIGSLTIHSGGTITHSSRLLSGLTLNVTGKLEVQLGGAIDVTGKGLLGGTCCPKTKGETFDENGQVVPGAEYTDGGAGGSYGGYGGQYIGYDVAYPFSPYGLIENPALLGSGGGSGGGYSPTPGIKTGGDGGGLVIVNTAKLLLNGDITANGAEGAYLGGSGSGGGINITVDSLLGSGKISANGGDGTDISGSGGGGRIALFFKYIDTPGPNSSAYGGKCIFTGNGCGNLTTGGAGTIYLKNVNQPNGKLIVGNDGVNSAAGTPLNYSNLSSFKSLTVKESAKITLDSLSNFDFQNAPDKDLIVESGGVLTIDTGYTHTPKSVSSDHGTVNIRTDFTANAALFKNASVLNVQNQANVSLPVIDEITLNSSIISLARNSILDLVSSTVVIGAGSSLIKDGRFGNNDVLSSLSILSGGLITHSARSLEGLHLKVTGNMMIEPGGLIDVNAKGLRGGNNGSQFGFFGESYSVDLTTIVSGAQGSSTGAGGSYGGIGEISASNAQPGPTYGDGNYPDLLGSGGGGGTVFSGEKGGHGGGKVYIETQNLTVNGIIRANGGNGNDNGGGGSGGSVLIFSDVIDGNNGTIEAKGGNGGCFGCAGGAGGGGRVAIYTTTPIFPAAHISTAPGTADSGTPEPGTIVYKACNYEDNVGIDTILIPAPFSIYPKDTIVNPVVVAHNYSPNTLIFSVSFTIGSFYADETFLNLKPGEQDTITFSPWHVAQYGTVTATTQALRDNDTCDDNNEKSLSVGIDSGMGPVISSVSPGTGGNTGSVTLEMKGDHFQEGSIAWIAQGGTQITAHYVDYISGAKIFASFNLSGATEGLYDVMVRNPDLQSTSFPNGFEVATGPVGWGGETSAECLSSTFDPGHLMVININHPANVRPTWIFPITISFTNTSNIDIPLSPGVLVRANQDTTKFAFDPMMLKNGGGEEELVINFQEEGGPSNILRAGVSGSIRVYAIASSDVSYDKVLFSLKTNEYYQIIFPNYSP
jgi:large repetitive protein